MACYCLTKTAWGAFGIVADSDRLLATYLPQKSDRDLRSRIVSEFVGAKVDADILPDLQHSVRQYFRGEPVEFDADLSFPGFTEFQRRVLLACRRISFGQTCTYGQLAKRAGHSGAARAVGSVMARNRFPLIIPCHRVLASGGVGGFSSDGGVDQKQAMLELERGAHGQTRRAPGASLIQPGRSNSATANA